MATNVAKGLEVYGKYNMSRNDWTHGLIRSKNTDFPLYFVLYTAMGITGKSVTTTTGDLFCYCCGYLPFYFTIFHPLEIKSRD